MRKIINNNIRPFFIWSKIVSQPVINFFKKNFEVITIFLLAFIVFIQTFALNFSWIDDGWSILVAKNLINDIKNFDLYSIAGRIFETNIGRFRPIYWLWQTLVYMIGGQSSGLHYFLHFILVFLILSIIYKITYHYSKSWQFSFLSSFIFLLFPVNAENWVRLGPAEPLMLLFTLLGLFYFFVKNSYKVSILFFTLSFFTKETALAALPAVFLYFILKRLIYKKRNNNDINLSIKLIIIAGISLFISFINKKGYSNSYVVDIPTIIYNFKLYLNVVLSNFKPYYLLLFSFVLINIRPIVNFRFKKIKEYEIIKLMFLALFLSFILIQSPWAWVLNRYLLPATAFASIYIGLELASICQNLKKNKYILYLFNMIIVLYFSIFFFYSLINLNQNIVRQKHLTQNLYMIFSSISKNIPEGGKVYFNFENNDATFEPLFEADLHFKLFHNRQDILVDFLENKKPKETNYLVVSSSLHPLGTFMYLKDKDITKDKKIREVTNLTKESSFVVVSDFGTVAKQLVKKVYNYLKNQEKIDGSGIYTEYLLRDTWRLYYY